MTMKNQKMNWMKAEVLYGVWLKKCIISFFSLFSQACSPTMRSLITSGSTLPPLRMMHSSPSLVCSSYNIVCLWSNSSLYLCCMLDYMNAEIVNEFNQINKFMYGVNILCAGRVLPLRLVHNIWNAHIHTWYLMVCACPGSCHMCHPLLWIRPINVDKCT